MPVGPLVDLPVGLDSCVAVFVYDGVGRVLVTSLKYHNRRAALPWLCLALAAQIVASQPSLPPDLVVSAVPTSSERRRRRGFDQAELLARGVAHHLGRPHKRLLIRRPGAPQTGRGRQERLRGPDLRARGPWSTPIVLVDDVLTSGATLATAARVLRAGGAPDVRGAVLSVTPLDSQGATLGRRQPGE